MTTKDALSYMKAYHEEYERLISELLRATCAGIDTTGSIPTIVIMEIIEKSLNKIKEINK